MFAAVATAFQPHALNILPFERLAVTDGERALAHPLQRTRVRSSRTKRDSNPLILLQCLQNVLIVFLAQRLLCNQHGACQDE